MKRRIIASDDESDEVKVSEPSIANKIPKEIKSFDSFKYDDTIASSASHDDGEGWLDARDVSQLTDKQRIGNVEKAKKERSEINKRTKRIICDDESDVDDFMSPNQKYQIRELDNEIFVQDTPIDVKKSAKATKKIKMMKNDVKGKAVVVLSSDDERSEFNGDESENSDSDNGYDEELDKVEVEERLKSIVKECEKLTSNLRKSLGMYASQSQGQSGDDINHNDCVSLLEMDRIAANSNQVIVQEDIQKLCPNLELKGYQLVGVNWLRLLQDNNINGVLADDMGLGKTVQTIAFLSWIASTRISQREFYPHLILVPASTLANWANELSRFCPSLQVLIYHGTQSERSQLQYNLKINQSEGSQPDVILSTYTIFERESGKSDRAFFYDQMFDYLICDEGHCLKNSSSARFINVNHIRSKYRLLLSGTPVQNDVKELLALLSFSMKHIFKPSICDLIIQAFSASSNNKKQCPLASSGQNILSVSQLRSMLAPFVLRRVKADVLNQLTAKTTVINKVKMTSMQKTLYDSILISHATKKQLILEKNLQEKVQDKFLSNPKPKNRTNTKSSTGSNQVSFIESKEEGMMTLSSSTNEDSSSVEEVEVESIVRDMTASEANSLFSALRKAANHPLLLRVRYNDPDVLENIAQVAYSYGHFGNQCQFDRVRNEIDDMSDFDIHYICMSYPDALSKYSLGEETLYDSPKMALLKDLIPKLTEQGHRILIFSQWTRILDLISVLIEALDMSYLRLDGSTPIKERQDFIDTFNNDSSIPVFLLSTKAGGLGINLCAADTVILHDLDFNPENDRQAEDRCHRIGQTKPVTVYKLVTADTVDESIFDMGERKRQLSEAVLANKHSDSHTLTTGHDKVNKGVASSTDDIGAIGWILQRALQNALKPSSKPSTTLQSSTAPTIHT